ncbi:hypothetical protein QVD17_01585 [Tagetes erecta]|uniref:Uncharacterized protein n=1 Tax=Tagetes erecta TaxID=13708 RepID=A0AAD8LAV5_TARER|nr:hypothetical protein QVD17_01585 [Tagetes erecta]
MNFKRHIFLVKLEDATKLPCRRCKDGLDGFGQPYQIAEQQIMQQKQLIKLLMDLDNLNGLSISRKCSLLRGKLAPAKVKVTVRSSTDGASPLLTEVLFTKVYHHSGLVVYLGD